MKRFIPILLLFLLIACEKEEKTITYKLTTEINPSEGGSVSPSSSTFDSGEEINLTATPAEGYLFKNWSGAISSTENPLALIINSDKTITAVFEKMDNDKDGVSDDIDQCLETTEGEPVDAQGCAESQKDTDGDGIQDSVDLCPETPESEIVDENGCSEGQKDTDNDGVSDELDQCDETPEGEVVDEQGCSDAQKDSDKDGVSDSLDQCPETPEGETVDENGCSDSQKDTDDDGVTDNLDLCSETPEGEIVDEQGCSDTQKDSDNDGVSDNLDQCPETPESETVDENGCTLSLKTYIPDDKFEQQLIDFGYDDVLDDYVVTANISFVETLVLGNIDGLIGLEDFISLRDLYMVSPNDASYTFKTENFPNLTKLSFDYGLLKSLEINKNSKLETLRCGLSLDLLSVTNNSSITHLDLDRAEIRSTLVSGNSNLIRFSTYFSGGEITLNDNPKLIEISFSQSSVERLNLFNNVTLESFSINLGYINGGVDFSKAPSLKSIIIDGGLNSVDVTSNNALESLSITLTGIETLDVSNNSLLKSLYAHSIDEPNLTCIKVNQQQLNNIPSGWVINDTMTQYSLDCPD